MVARLAVSLIHVLLRLVGLRSKLILSPEVIRGLESGEILPSVITVSPHGAYAIGHIFYSMARVRLDPIFAPFRGRAAAASVLFKVPIVRELLLLMNIREAKKSTLDGLLRNGQSVAINTGGIWEQARADAACRTAFASASGWHCT